jgi:chemotaxis response regulator CheB
MSDNFKEKSRDIAETTRRLSSMNIDLVKRSQEMIKATREAIDRTRETLSGSNPDWILPNGANSYPETLPLERSGRAGMTDPGKIVVIGGSAGSVMALRATIHPLPKDFLATVFIVQHSSPGWPAMFSGEFIQRYSPLPVHVAADLEPFQVGRLYYCPPNHHLSLENGLMRLEKSPAENLTRPSIDVLFRSAAAAYGRRMIGVLLSGTLRDGTAGLWQIKKRGGVAIVQDPSEAEYSGMPRNAIENVSVDYVLPAGSIGGKLTELVHQNRSGLEWNARRPKILVVEDEPLAAQNLQERLDELAYQTCGSVRSGEDAIAAAIEKVPDLVLMDIRLEGNMSGIEAARQIWERLQTPVVFVTAHADLATLAAVKSTENYGYLVKPFHLASVQATVELALDRREKELRRSG